MHNNLVESQTWLVLAYGHREFADQLYLDLIGSIGWSDNDSRRVMTYDTGTTAPQSPPGPKANSTTALRTLGLP